MWETVGKQDIDKIAQRYQNKCMKESKVRERVETYVQKQQAWENALSPTDREVECYDPNDLKCS